MKTCVVLLVVLAMAAVSIPTVGCGSGGGDDPASGARIGPMTYILPFAPAGAGQTVTLGFKNLLDSDAGVFVSAWSPAGASYNLDGDPITAGIQPVPLTVPGNGELRVPISAVVGLLAFGGWLEVETRNPAVLDPVTGEPTVTPSSGYVIPYISRTLVGADSDADSLTGLVGRSSGVRVSLTEGTTAIQLVNRSYNQGAGGVVPITATFTVATFDAAGALLAAPVGAIVFSNGSVPLPIPPGARSIRIEPAAAGLPPPVPPLLQVFSYAVVAQENGLHLHAEGRFHETDLSHLSPQLILGFEVEFAADADTNMHDFEVLMSNPTAVDQTVQLTGVYLDGAAPLLAIPRTFVLTAGRTVIMRTQTADSVGLVVPEVSLFDDIFGNVFAPGAIYRRATLFFQVPSTIDLSARHFDPSFGSFYQVLRAFPHSNDVCVFDLPIQESLLTGIRNTISITNPTNGDVTVPVEAYTPLGTRYTLTPITVPALSRAEFVPDGVIYKNDPTDVMESPVPYVRFRFTPSTGLFFRGRTARYVPSGAFDYLVSTIVRDN